MPSKEEYYLNIAEEVAERSKCLRNKGGAIIVRDDQIISTGYIGAPRKTKDCLERNECVRDKMNIPHGKQYEMCRSVHAEMNAIINAARSGVSLLGGDIYIHCKNPKDGKIRDGFPCFLCKRMIINAGLKRVICSLTAGGMKIFNTEDWAKEWTEGDIVDDVYQFGTDLNKQEGYKS